MNKPVEPVTVERVLEEIEDEVTLLGAAHAAPPDRARSRATLPIALIVPAIFFGGLVVVLLLRGNPVAALRGPAGASVAPVTTTVTPAGEASPAGASGAAAVPNATQRLEPGAPAEPASTVARSSATTEDMAVEESQSAVLRFMARGTVKDLPAPRRPGAAPAVDGAQAAAPAVADATSRAAGAPASAAANIASAANGANASGGQAGALVAGKGNAAVGAGAEGAGPAQGAASAVQQAAAPAAAQATPVVAQPPAASAATNTPGTSTGAAGAVPLAAAVIPAPPPAPLRPVERPSPTFPVEALRDGIRSGRVLAALTVAPDGSVSNVRVLEFAPNASFSRAAQRALRNWRFASTGTGGQATVELLFKSEE